MFGPFVDKADGVTLKTDSTTITDIDHATTGIFLSKAGAAAAVRHATVTASVADAYGMMKVTLDTTDTGTLGTLDVLFAKAATYLPVHKQFMVLPANIFDSLVSGSDLVDVSVTQLAGVAQSLTDLKDFADTGYDPSTHKVTGVVLTDTATTLTGVSVATVAAGVWDLDATAHQTAGTFGKAIGDPLTATNSLIQRTPDAVAGATNGLFIAGTNAATTITTALTTTFTGNLTGSVGSVTGLTAATVHSDLDDIQSRLPAALTANGNMKSSLVEILTTALTETAGLLAGGFKKFFNIATPASTMDVLARVTLTDTVTTYTGNTPQTGDTYALANGAAGFVAIDTVVDAIKVKTDDLATSADIVDAVWDEATSGHTTSGTTGKALIDAGGAGTPPTAAEVADAVWDEDATAHQTGGTFGQAIGDPGADGNTIFKAVVTDATGATVGVDVVDLKTQIGTAGAGLTAINLPDQTMNITGDITGNLSGSVGSVTGLTAATVHSDLDDIQARLPAALSAGGNIKADVLSLGGVVQSLTDLKDFADTGYDPSTHKVAGVVLTDTVTTYTGNTKQTADVATLITTVGVAGAGLTAADDAVIAAIGALNDFDPAVDAVAHVTLTDTVTTYTGNTKQTADVATLITTVGAAGAGLTAADDAVIAAIGALKDFDPAVDVVARVTLTDTVTTYTGNTKQTANVADLITTVGVAGAGLTAIDLPNQTMDITGNLSGSVGSVTGAVGSVTGFTASDIAAMKLVTDQLSRSAFAIVQGTCDSGGTTTAVVATSLAPTSSVDDQFNGRIVIFAADTATAALRGQATDITNYDHATKTFTVTALTTAPASGDTFCIV